MNSITRSQLVGSFYEIYITMHGSINIKLKRNQIGKAYSRIIWCHSCWQSQKEICSPHRTTRKKVKTGLYNFNNSWCWIVMLLFRLPMYRLHLHSKFHRRTQSSSTANLKTPLALLTAQLNFLTTGNSIIPINMTNELCSQNIRSKSSLGWDDLWKCYHQYIAFKNPQNSSINCEFR